jgi:hypothetical protein
MDIFAIHSLLEHYLDTSIQSPRHEAFYTAISKDRWEQINRYFHIWKLTQPTELTELAEPIRLANPDQKATPLHVAAFNGEWRHCK